MHYIMNTRTKKAKSKTNTKTKTKQSNYKKKSLKRQQRKTRKVGGYNHFVSPYPHPTSPEVRPPVAPATPAEAFSDAHATPYDPFRGLSNNQQLQTWYMNYFDNTNNFQQKDKGIFELFKELLNNCKNHYYQQNDTDYTMFKRFFKRDKMKNIDNICDSNKPTECIDNNDNNDNNQYIQLRDFIKNNTQKGKRAQFQRICKYIEQLELNQGFHKPNYHNELLQNLKKKLIHYISSQVTLSNINRMSLYTLLMKYMKFANEIKSSQLIPGY